ncbi:uncharacterized protein EV420DRAFT_335687 [Desarmillaria tabescens]|uniref:Uncharacterized protein n=1 Tax=Armillaria tabescens TaxID=1929756 RepID=A0AA39N695_ARMTA|nr:uncharacterized protein EV420DRAFT_335687 [Desarmillaria tabescens]KAK0458855.1 hypothetical protein EV420DRAFT_335687 [Desarmillaria tabescens]
MTSLWHPVALRLLSMLDAYRQYNRTGSARDVSKIMAAHQGYNSKCCTATLHWSTYHSCSTHSWPFPTLNLTQLCSSNSRCTLSPTDGYSPSTSTVILTGGSTLFFDISFSPNFEHVFIIRYSDVSSCNELCGGASSQKDHRSSRAYFAPFVRPSSPTIATGHHHAASRAFPKMSHRIRELPMAISRLPSLANLLLICGNFVDGPRFGCS